MKLRILLGLMMLLALQTRAQEFIHYGVTFGMGKAILLNSSDFNLPETEFKEIPNTKPNFGLEIGLNSEKPIAMVVQFLYAKQGQSYKGSRVINSVYYDWNTIVALDYVKVPMLIEWKPTEYKKFKPSLALGLYGAYRINWQDKTTYTDTFLNNPSGYEEVFTNRHYAINYNDDFFTDISVDTKKNLYTTFNVGLIAGAGINYKVGKHTYFDAKLMADYSISTPENQSYKELKPYRWSFTTNRVGTHLVNYGLQLSLRYQLKESDF